MLHGVGKAMLMRGGACAAELRLMGLVVSVCSGAGCIGFCWCFRDIYLCLSVLVDWGRFLYLKLYVFAVIFVGICSVLAIFMFGIC